MATYQPIYKTPDGERVVMAIYEKALANWPVPYERLNLLTRHGETFAIACGPMSAPPLILLHGAGTNSAIWGADMAEYSQHFRVYAVDLLGEAGKSAPNRPAWESQAYAEWLDDVFYALGIEKAVLVGISQGGWTALKFAVSRPERVEKLVLMCPGGIIPDRVSFVFRAIGLSLLGEWGTKRLVQMLYGGQAIPEGVEEIIVQMTRNFKPRMGVLPIFSDAELRRLTMPTLLIGGTADAMRDIPKIAARLKNFLPQLEVTIIPGAGHVLMNTTARILRFLKAEEHAL